MTKTKINDFFQLKEFEDYKIIINDEDEVYILYKINKSNYTSKKAYVVLTHDGEAITLDSSFFDLSEEEDSNIEEFKFE